MRKYKLISALAEETAKEVVRNEESWRRYLNTASRLYKYPFKEQLLIYAQRPDATACASIEIWNEKMHCWVNKGAKGIALIDEDSFSGLKYVFDISDVHKARRIGQFPSLWGTHGSSDFPFGKNLWGHRQGSRVCGTYPGDCRTDCRGLL